MLTTIAMRVLFCAVLTVSMREGSRPIPPSAGECDIHRDCDGHHHHGPAGGMPVRAVFHQVHPAMQSSIRNVGQQSLRGDSRLGLSMGARSLSGFSRESGFGRNVGQHSHNHDAEMQTMMLRSHFGAPKVIEDCPQGAECTRRDPTHFTKFKHPKTLTSGHEWFATRPNEALVSTPAEAESEPALSPRAAPEPEPLPQLTVRQRLTNALGGFSNNFCGGKRGLVAAR